MLIKRMLNHVSNKRLPRSSALLEYPTCLASIAPISADRLLVVGGRRVGAGIESEKIGP